LAIVRSGFGHTGARREGIERDTNYEKRVPEREETYAGRLGPGGREDG